MNSTRDKSSVRIAQAAGARLAEAAAAAMAGLPVARLRGPCRGDRAAARARQIAMYLTHVVFGLSLTRVGVSFGRDRTTVAHACRSIEDKRDQPGAEFGLAAIEAGLMALAQALRPAGTREARR